MKNLINIAIVSLTLLISNYALADFQDGLNAYDKQDYAAALKEWKNRVCITLKLTPYFLSLFF
jgi:hypothetical protein